MLRRNAALAVLRALLLPLALGCGISACGGAISSSPTPQSSPTRGPLPTPTPVGLETPAAGKIYLGAYVNPRIAPLTITALETTIGRKLAINMHYYGWTATFPLAAENSDTSYGRLAVDSWNCAPTNAQVAAGLADPLILTRALTVKAFGHPVFIRYLWDMNLPVTVERRGQCYDPSTDNANGTFSGPQYIAAWLHIRQLFANAGVTNAIWVWSPSSAGSDPTPYYPGDAAVDWIGFDAYDTTGQGFAPTFASLYAAWAPHNKPMMVSETGEVQSLQPEFFNDAASTLQTSFPQIKAFMYWDSYTHSSDFEFNRITLPSFITMANEPYFAAFGSL